MSQGYQSVAAHCHKQRQNCGKRTMVNLANELVLGKVLPKRNSFYEVVRVVKPMRTNPWERVARCTSVGAGGEEARH